MWRVQKPRQGLGPIGLGLHEKTDASNTFVSLVESQLLFLLADNFVTKLPFLARFTGWVRQDPSKIHENNEARLLHCFVPMSLIPPDSEELSQTIILFRQLREESRSVRAESKELIEDSRKLIEKSRRIFDKEKQLLLEISARLVSISSET